MTRYTATAGGQDWLATPARRVRSPCKALIEKALEPCADDSPPHTQASSPLRQGQAIGAPQEDLTALGQPRLDGGRAWPVFQLSPFNRGKNDRVVGFAAACHRRCLLSRPGQHQKGYRAAAS